jgi:hypothetical protein
VSPGVLNVGAHVERPELLRLVDHLLGQGGLQQAVLSVAPGRFLRFQLQGPGRAVFEVAARCIKPGTISSGVEVHLVETDPVLVN